MDRRRGVLLLGWPLGSLAVAVVAGVLTGAAVHGRFAESVVDVQSAGSTAEVGAVLMTVPLEVGRNAALFGGLAFAVVLGFLVWGAGLILGAHRLFAESRRVRPVVATFALGAVGGPVVALVVQEIAGGPLDPVRAAVVIVAVCAAASAVFPLYDRATAGRPVVTGAGYGDVDERTVDPLHDRWVR